MAHVARQAKEITSVADLAGVLSKATGNSRLLFRGQNVDEPLLPKIARLAEDRGISHEQLDSLERRMLERFKKESVPLLRGLRPRSDWDWLSIAQHQGLSTRLLDWSANALAGLWFAVAADALADATTGVLWVLEVSPANEKSPAESDDIFSLRRTYVFQPFHVDQRIVAQAAWFSVHRYAEKHGKFIPLDRNRRFSKSLKRYPIPKTRFESLRRELRLMGVTQATMFPDMSGLCAEIQADCLGSLRPLPTI